PPTWSLKDRGLRADTGATPVTLRLFNSLVDGGFALRRSLPGWLRPRQPGPESANSATEARFRALVQHSSDLIAIVDRDATLRYTSPAVKQILRRDPETLVGTPLLTLLAPSE